MFGLFLLVLIGLIVWRVKKAKSRGFVEYPETTLDVEDDVEPSDYVPSAPTRTTYKPSAYKSRTKPSSSSPSFGGRSGGSGFGGGRSGGGGSSSSW